ncbi:MAG: YcfL family protein [Burkholderiales bacterium]|nr:YcfL family protein [Burkholderiales bacterium]
MKRIIIVLASVGLLASCATGTNDRVVNVSSNPNVFVVSGSVKSQRVNGLLKSQAVLHNSNRSAINGFYRCKFSDANGMQVGDDQIWQSVTLYPNADQTIGCRASDIEATDFKVEFSADGKTVTALTY